ncbi:MAG: hypothetical protein ACR2H9_22685 [Longimicrobiaceae bacterium]
MTPTTLDAPARPQPAAASAPPPPAPPAPRRPRRSGATYGRVLRWSLLLSLLAHLLVLVISPSFLRVGAPPGETDTARDPAAAPGMRMVDPALIPDAPAPTQLSQAAEETPLFDLPAPAPGPRVPVQRATPGARTPAVAPATRGDAPDNPLRPGLRDPRLWVTPRELPPPPEPTQEELHARYMEQLQGRLDALNDSISGDAERARRATNWTVKDKQGRRWGASPEGIHLGGVTLPPIRMQGDRDKELAAQEKERQRQEIIRQAEDAERRQVREERIRATRERRDAERRPPES